VDVYVALYETRYGVPSWMADFTDTGTTLTSRSRYEFQLYKKSFAAGTVTLGGNEYSTTRSSRTYVVIAVEPGTGP
jgi:hypothetical protein